MSEGQEHDGVNESAVEVTFKIKAGAKTHTVTISESALVQDLKDRLAGNDFEGIPADRQRLIYSGRVMKNTETIGSYKIKAGNTVHLVKSAASNIAAPAATPAIPQNMAAGTNNSTLSGLVGARYAGMASLPNASMFGPDGGMGPPPSADQLARMMESPDMQQSMNAALDSPEFIDTLMAMHPQFSAMPREQVRSLLQSPFMRQMMTNPDMMRMAANIGGPSGLGGLGGAGSASGSSEPGARAGSGNAPPSFGGLDLASLFGVPRPRNGTGAAAGTDAGAGSGAEAAAGTDATAGTGDGAAASTGGSDNARPFAPLIYPNLQALLNSRNRAPGEASSVPAPDPNDNPFLQLFGPPGVNHSGHGDPNAPGVDLISLLNALQGPGAAGGQGPRAPAPPADTRPPEEIYATQLSQLNDMGFYDFDRNIAALRRSGGNVQGAVEHLLGGI